MNNGQHLRIFVLIDALGWEFLKQKEFLSDLLPCRMPLRTVLGFSSGAIPTILTGLPPEQNGHWNLFYYDPQHSPFRWVRYFTFLPQSVLEHRVTRRLIKEVGRRILGMGPLFECCVSPQLLPWFNWIEKRNIYGSRGIVNASSIFDQLAEKGISYRAYSYHDGSDEEILQQAKKEVGPCRFSFLFLYLSELDLFLHHNCHDPARWEQRLDWYATRLRELFQHAQEHNFDLSFTIMSDHGMTPVRHHHDLVKEEQLEWKTPKDYLAVYDSTMARFWFFNEDARRKITQHLQNQLCGQVLSEQQLRDFGVFFPDHRYGELIFLMRPGWMLSRSDFNGRGWMPVGMHGYDPADPYSDAVFLSNRRPTTPLRTIADVYQCMGEALAQ